MIDISIDGIDYDYIAIISWQFRYKINI